MKTLSTIAITSAVGAAISKDDIIFIISIVVTILNLVMEYLKRRKNEAKLEKN